MSKVSVIYFSQTGLTRQLVKSLTEGLETSGMKTHVHEILGTEIIEGRYINKELFEEIKTSSAIVFASPTYMGGPAAQFKAFADASSEYWSDQLWSGKIAAGITCGGAPNGDQTSTIQYFCTLASQHGMLWLGLDLIDSDGSEINRLGCQLGVVSHVLDNKINPVDSNTAQYLGKRIAKMLRKFEQVI